jgi:hypothetical protein
MKELETEMTMFDKMLHIIGEEDYATRIRGALANLTDLKLSMHRWKHLIIIQVLLL